MLAEIFMLRLEATARAAKEAATITRSTSPFVPVTLPVRRRRRLNQPDDVRRFHTGRRDNPTHIGARRPVLRD